VLAPKPFGVGGELVSRLTLASGNFGEITKAAAKYLAAIRDVHDTAAYRA
jgi:hypothetical protein